LHYDAPMPLQLDAGIHQALVHWTADSSHRFHLTELSFHLYWSHKDKEAAARTDGLRWLNQLSASK